MSLQEAIDHLKDVQKNYDKYYKEAAAKNAGRTYEYGCGKTCNWSDPVHTCE